MHRIRFSIVFIAAVILSPLSQAAEAVWQHFRFSEPEEVAVYFRSVNYSVDNWDGGDRSVPRVYLTLIPASWREHYAGQLSTAEKKRYFFFILTPMILRANESVLAEREFLQGLQKKQKWSTADTAELAEIAEEYGSAAPTGANDKEAMSALLHRVDVVPCSMAMAQAAIESGWGTSRFAAEGNALFGQWTWGDDAIVPTRVRTELGNYGIRSFPTPFESIAAYIHNLNTHDAYASFRDLRGEARRKKANLSGIEMAAGLEKYSERGQIYVEEVRSLIRGNRLHEIDEAYLRDDVPVELIPEDEKV